MTAIVPFSVHPTTLAVRFAADCGRSDAARELVLTASSSTSRRSAFGYAADDRSAAYCRRRLRFNQTVAAFVQQDRIEICDHDSSVELKSRVLPSQLRPPAIDRKLGAGREGRVERKE